MCGIAGLFSLSDQASPVDLSELEACNLSMAARGPDGHAIWSSENGRVGLAHRRLAIIDPGPSGAQPMHDVTGRYTITFNGEIYNYRELRADLEARGYRFQTGSDTETIINLYDHLGEAMPARLRGMFTFAIHDRQTETLFIARDPFGIKPLYYAEDGRTFRFASTVSALVATGKVRTEIDPAAEAGFFTLGYIPDPHTIWRAIRAVPAGSSLTLTPGQPVRMRSFFSVSDRIAEGSAAVMTSDNDITACLRQSFDDAIRAHMVSDVPVGAFLSAGIDSTAIVGRAVSAGFDQMRTVTLGFNEFRGDERDEVPLAESVATAWGTDHRTITVSRDDFSNARDALFADMDQPTIDGVNSWFVAKATASTGLKVALSGLGGDELLGGYPSFHQVPRMVSMIGGSGIPGGLGRAFRIVSAPVISRLSSPKYAGLLEYGGDYGGAYLLRRGLFMPWELPDVMEPERAAEGLEALDLRARMNATAGRIDSARGKVAALEMTWYMRGQLLKDADWAGMAHSLEIRVPLVDPVLLGELAPLIRSDQPVAKRHLAALSPERMPPQIAGRPKTGFAVPVRDWLLADDGGADERGLRGWARYVWSRKTGAPATGSLAA